VRTFKIIAIAATAITAASLATSIVGTANAQSQAVVTFDTGNVAIGYSDGYWDRTHNWHAWQAEKDRQAYQAAKNAEYHEWKHDRDKDMGWHERHY
jgi:hypothetical protein